ncbi:hypothetical protein CMEL01_05730 [Colletotrichum melonis]|uniref:Uncharacterized protein n=1 Tax=Colletotrichum melonis TaxID=1209925 RepID=A0AAI9UCQ6_9PEZI|nr:hypothetical protein CMEL01_05730 [Colletotrichum melonis]
MPLPFRLRASCVQRQVPSTTTTWAAGAEAGAGIASETSSFACTLQSTKVHMYLYVPVQPGNTGHCTLGRFVYRPVSFSPFPRRDSDDSFEKLSLEPAHFSLVLSGLICHCPQDQGALSCCASDLRSKPRSDL